MGTFANSENPDEMQHNAAFHQGLHCLLRLKQPSGTEICHNLENSICDPLKYTLGSPILVVSICMGKAIRIQLVKYRAFSSNFGKRPLAKIGKKFIDLTSKLGEINGIDITRVAKYILKIKLF